MITLSSCCALYRTKTTKTGNKESTTCFAILLQNGLNSDVARFTTQVRTSVLQQIELQGFFVGGKTRKITIQPVLQQYCKTLVARFLFLFYRTLGNISKEENCSLLFQLPLFFVLISALMLLSHV